MNGLRFWILLFAVVSFASGAALGRLVTQREMRDAQREAGPLADFEALFVEQFELGPTRARHLHTILQRYEQDLERIKNEGLAEYRSAMEPEIRALARQYDYDLRDKVLPPSKRGLFDDLALASRPLAVR